MLDNDGKKAQLDEDADPGFSEMQVRPRLGCKGSRLARQSGLPWPLQAVQTGLQSSCS